ncbi:MAG: transporter [Planctomycetota bacterium]|jgi:hypothetical protein
MRRSLALSLAAAIAATALLGGAVRAEGRILQQRKPFSWLDPNCPTCSGGIVPPGTALPEGTTPMPANVQPPVQAPQPALTEPTPQIAPMVSAALGDASFAVAAPGYIDFAKPMNQVRLRYDAAYNMNRPDRAEYFYGKCGCFGGNAPGPILPERNVDAQETSLYLEVAPTQRFSVFVDLPIRAINPDVNANATGMGDMRFGFKYAFIYDDVQILSLQVRAFAPTGDPRQGLGTSHWSVEPSLLYTRQLSERVTLYGEFGNWSPINGTEFAGSMLYYGAGLGYTAYDSGDFRITPLVEFIGWSVLNGQELNLDAGGAVNAGGDTIVNGKLGVRAGGPRHDFYVGYGRALTGAVWYQDIARFEYRFKF